MAWEEAVVAAGQERTLVVAVTLPAQTLTHASQVVAVVMVVVVGGEQLRMEAAELPLELLAVVMAEEAVVAVPSRTLRVELVAVAGPDVPHGPGR